MSIKFDDTGEVVGTPRKSRVVFDDEQKTNWKGVVGQGIKEAFMRPGTVTRKLASDPVAQAKALPPLAGLAGAITPIPATSMVIPARQLSNLVLKTYGRSDQIPSGTSQALEGAGAILGDVLALPYAKKAYYGSQIGKAEEMAGVPKPQDIPSLPRPKPGEPVSGGIDSAIESVKASEGRGTPTYWKQIKDQIDSFYEQGKDIKLTSLDRAKLRWLSGKVQEGLNASVPGRSIPSEAMGQAMTVPRFIGKQFNRLPPKFRSGLGYGTGFGAPVVAIEEIVRRLIGK